MAKPVKRKSVAVKRMVEKTKKPAVKPEPTIKLTPRQQAALRTMQNARQKMLRMGEDEPKQMIVRSGYGGAHGMVQAGPGTGKTFTMMTSVAWMFRKANVMGRSLWSHLEGQVGKVQPTAEQQKVWDFISQGADGEAVNIGKHGSKLPRTIRYVAYNNSIVNDFEEKWSWLTKLLEHIGTQLTFSTINSLGYGVVRKAYGLNPYKGMRKWKTSDLLSALWGVDLREVWKQKADEIQAITGLVEMCKLTLTGMSTDEDGVNNLQYPDDWWFEELDTLAAKQGLEIEDKEKTYATVRTLLEQSCQHDICKAGVDYPDQLWLPIVNNLFVDKINLLLIDEVQDMCRASQELALKAGDRIVCVGDPRQAIYAFAGADTQSMDRMAGTLNGQSFYLTETRRCPPRIVQEAIGQYNKIWTEAPLSSTALTSYKKEPGTVRRVNWDGAYIEYKPGDMVLCRMNAPLISVAFALLKDKRPVQIQGRPIGASLRALVKLSGAKQVADFITWLAVWEEEKLQAMAKRRVRDDEAMAALQDKCEILQELAARSKSILDLDYNIKQLDKVFNGRDGKQPKDDSKRQMWRKGRAARKEAGYSRESSLGGSQDSVTLLSTGHRAKGLEAKRVFILRPDLIPHKLAKTKEAREQEANLMWVMTTRSMGELVYVDGKRDVKVDVQIESEVPDGWDD